MELNKNGTEETHPPKNAEVGPSTNTDAGLSHPARFPQGGNVSDDSGPDDKAAAALEKRKQESEFPFGVEVGDIYEGPLDLLLDLIRKQDIDIYDVPIARITAQYLAYVEKMRDLDVNVAAEFIYMASLLIHIKSKMLLPRDPDLPP